MIVFLDIIHRPVIFLLLLLFHNIPETEFCLCLQIKHTQLGPIDGASPYIRT
jgi:hypothetical protein